VDKRVLTWGVHWLGNSVMHMAVGRSTSNLGHWQKLKILLDQWKRSSIAPQSRTERRHLCRSNHEDRLFTRHQIH
jgi:hypothetical protein